MSTEINRELTGDVAAVLERYGRQNDWPASTAAEIPIVARRFAAVAVREQLATRGATIGADGEPVELAADLIAKLTKEITAAVREPERLAAPVKHLLKGCFQAAPRKCRDEYRENEASGGCRRQSLAKARERVSGAFCVDCPYWRLTAAQHEKLFAHEWVGDAAEFAAHRGIFLPEDFRALRRRVSS